MYRLKNGYTKKDMIWYVNQFNNGKQCMSAEGCLYENKDNHCAVGCFIPWGHEGMKSPGTVDSLLLNYPDLKNYMPLSEVGMLEFQRVHDNEYEDENVKTSMIDWIEKNVR